MKRFHLFPKDERAALQITDFRRMWLGESVSLVGSQVSLLALPTLLILSAHANTLEVSLLGFAQYAALIAGLIRAGSTADRSDPRRVMPLADLMRALALFSVVIVAAVARVPTIQVILAALVLGIGRAFFDTSYSAVQPRLMSGRTLAGGNSLFGQSQYFAFCAGPPLAGLLIRLVGSGSAVAVDAATFLISAVFVLMLSQRVLPARVDDSPVSGTGEAKTTRRSAVGFVWKTPALRLIALTVATGNLGIQMVQGVYLIFLYRTLHLSAGFVGLAFGLGGVAGIFGARLASPAARRLGTGQALMLSTMLAGASWLVLFIPGIPRLLTVSIAATVISLALPLFGVVQATLRQEVTPSEFQGRAAAGVSFIGLSSVPVGYLTGGLVGELWGVRYAVLAGSFIALASGAWCAPLISRLRGDAFDQHGGAEPVSEC